MTTENVSEQEGIQKVPRKEIKKRLIFVFKLILFLGLIVIQYRYPIITGNQGISSNIIDAVLFFITAHMIISFSRLIIVYSYIKRSGRQFDFINNFILGVNQIAHILSFVMFIFALFLVFNIKASEFFTSISIVAAAIAIVSKDYISNMINGMIIMFSDELSLDDYVKIGEHRGKISNITLLNMHIVNEDDDLVYVPNNYIMAADIVNFTKHDIQKITVEFELNQTYLKYYGTLKQALESVLNEHSKSIKKNSPVLKIIKIHKDAVQFKYQFRLLHWSKPIEKEIRKKILERVLYIINDGEMPAIPLKSR